MALLAAPTLYCKLFESDQALAKRVYILEYDKRFSVYDLGFLNVNFSLVFILLAFLVWSVEKSP